MFKVIIVDDEMLIRKRIRYGFDWEMLGYQVADDVEGGQQALDLMEKNHYDLAIVDIAMPGMNGIELAKEIRERGYPTHMIFLTGHSDFKYAQQALRFGVYYYILKPVNEEEFVSTLEKLREKMAGEAEERRVFQQLSEKRKSVDAVLKSKLFGSYFHDAAYGPVTEEMREILWDAGFGENSTYMAAVFRAALPKDNPADPEVMTENMEKLCRGVLPQNCHTAAFFDLYEDFVILILDAGEYTSGGEADGYLESVCQAIKTQWGWNGNCGAGLSCLSVEGLRKSFEEAVSAVHNARILGEDFLSYRMVKERGNTNYKIPVQDIRELQYQVSRNDFGGCQAVLRKIFKELETHKVNFECIAVNANRLFLGLVDTGVISELDVKRFLNGSHDVGHVMENLADLEEMEQWFENLVYYLMENEIRSSSENKSLPIIEKTCRYIRSHYSDGSLSQNGIAEAMAVTPSYLSGIFKKRMKISIVQYITMVRMEKARELLLTSEEDVCQVAGDVGYNDEYYFSRCFKKQYGMSPAQLRKVAGTKRIGEIGEEFI